MPDQETPPQPSLPHVPEDFIYQAYRNRLMLANEQATWWEARAMQLEGQLNQTVEELKRYRGEIDTLAKEHHGKGQEASNSRNGHQGRPVRKAGGRVTARKPKA